MPSLGVGSSDIFSGFPDITSGGNIRFCPFLISVVAGGRSGRYVYQLVEKPGWDLVPTFYGGFVPLRVVSFFGESGCWWPLRRQIPCLLAI
jgi:hypothetical protein